MRLSERALRKLRRDGPVALGKSVARSGLNGVFSALTRWRQRWWLFQLRRRDYLITREGVAIDLSGEYLKDRYRTLFMDGVPEMEELRSLQRHLPTNRDVIELGGGIGFIACYVNQHLDAEATHLVVEANERLIPSIERNRRLNGCTFETIHRAYAAEVDSVQFYLSDSFLESSTNETRASRSTSPGEWPIVEEVEVPAVDLDTLVSEHDLDDFVLIADIEGSEADLLTNEMELLESHCSYLFIEFHLHPEVRDEVEQARLTLERSFELVEENRQRETLIQCVYRVGR